ncbi:hypothetical protein BV898_00446 [Hypsibius exemplaris]|uniref:Uncharacterized protein n=1 Tax=Hypsibius exemplaris TaxID=2072580 RepID=A0A1W0XDE8_HYPEX|nr:hypothetical protein BV898_00446 [Hypsibius exemplaris]
MHNGKDHERNINESFQNCGASLAGMFSFPQMRMRLPKPSQCGCKSETVLTARKVAPKSDLDGSTVAAAARMNFVDWFQLECKANTESTHLGHGLLLPAIKVVFKNRDRDQMKPHPKLFQPDLRVIMRVAFSGSRHVTDFCCSALGTLGGRTALTKHCSGLFFLERKRESVPGRLFHEAATSPASQDSLNPTLPRKLSQVKDNVELQARRSDFRDSLSVIAGWTAVAMGLALSIHASRSMIAGHQSAVLLQERDNLPVPPDQLLDEA